MNLMWEASTSACLPLVWIIFSSEDGYVPHQGNHVHTFPTEECNQNINPSNLFNCHLYADFSMQYSAIQALFNEK